jgi:hypothetical protein
LVLLNNLIIANALQKARFLHPVSFLGNLVDRLLDTEKFFRNRIFEMEEFLYFEDPAHQKE